LAMLSDTRRRPFGASMARKKVCMVFAAAASSV
jgi:hypothetical protein